MQVRTLLLHYPCLTYITESIDLEETTLYKTKLKI